MWYAGRFEEVSPLRLNAGEYPGGLRCGYTQEALRYLGCLRCAMRRRSLRCVRAGGFSVAIWCAGKYPNPMTSRRCLRDVAPCRLSLDAGPRRQGAWPVTWLARARSAYKGVPLELHRATSFRAHGELPHSGLAGVRETSVQTSPVTGAGIGLSCSRGRYIKQVRV